MRGENVSNFYEVGDNVEEKLWQTNSSTTYLRVSERYALSWKNDVNVQAYGDYWQRKYKPRESTAAKVERSIARHNKTNDYVNDWSMIQAYGEYWQRKYKPMESTAVKMERLPEKSEMKGGGGEEGVEHVETIQTTSSMFLRKWQRYYVERRLFSFDCVKSCVTKVSNIDFGKFWEKISVFSRKKWEIELRELLQFFIFSMFIFENGAKECIV